jgi:hypothetical protein
MLKIVAVFIYNCLLSGDSLFHKHLLRSIGIGSSLVTSYNYIAIQ